MNNPTEAGATYRCKRCGSNNHEHKCTKAGEGLKACPSCGQSGPTKVYREKGPMGIGEAIRCVCGIRTSYLVSDPAEVWNPRLRPADAQSIAPYVERLAAQFDELAASIVGECDWDQAQRVAFTEAASQTRALLPGQQPPGVDVERLPDDEAAALRIIDKAFRDAGLKRPFFGEAYEPGVVVKSIVEQVALHTPAPAEVSALAGEVLNDIAVMMSEFVDNWPNPKKVSTALALIAKTMRAALDPPKHRYWGAGESDCPRDIKAGNGELHTLRCKVCGEDNPRDDRCLRPLRHTSTATAEIAALRHDNARQMTIANEATNRAEQARQQAIEEAYDKARGTNADLCKTPGEAYRLMLDAIRKISTEQTPCVPPTNHAERD